MTFVGKILVIVIMAFALLFLGISTVVFTTASNWKAETEKQRQRVNELDRKNRDATELVKERDEELKKARLEHDAAKKDLQNRVASLEDEIQRLQADVTTTRGALETAQTNARTALDEADSRRKETDLIREQKSAVEKQANEFKLRQTELVEKIRELTRQLETATTNNKDLRDRVDRLGVALRSAGLSDDPNQYKSLSAPPPVQGEVARVDRRNQRVELTIGSDDGLVPGHELYLYRTKPRPQYLGKVRIISVDPDQAVGQMIGGVLHGIQIQEGDHVSTSLRAL
jgi:multidrug efflux pump subunit AcrA (membrane-fusion protein)